MVRMKYGIPRRCDDRVQTPTAEKKKILHLFLLWLMFIHATRSDCLSTASLCCLLQSVGDVLYKFNASFYFEEFMIECDLIKVTENRHLHSAQSNAFKFLLWICKQWGGDCITIDELSPL